MTRIEMDDQRGPVFLVRLDFELDRHFLTTALHNFTYDAMDEVAKLTDAEIQDQIAFNIAFEGVGALMTAAWELDRSGGIASLDQMDRQWLEFCRKRVSRAYVSRPLLRVA